MATLAPVSTDERASARIKLIQTARSLYAIEPFSANDTALCLEIVSHEVAIDATTRDEYRNGIAHVLISMHLVYTERRAHPDLASWAVWKFFVKRKHCMHWLHTILSLSGTSLHIPMTPVFASAMKRLRYELAIAPSPDAFFAALARVTTACGKVPITQRVHVLSTDDTTGESLRSRPEFRDAFLWQRFFPQDLRKTYIGEIQNAMRPHVADADRERAFKECEQLENEAFAQALSLALYLSTLAGEMQRISRWHEFVNVANMEWESTNTIVVNVED